MIGRMDHEQSTCVPERAIAIIGMAGRFPGAPDIARLWANLRDGVESIASFSDEELLAPGVDPSLVAHPNYVNAKGVLAEIESFDAALFGFSPREAAITDPQQRLFLECAWEALEVSGYHGDAPGPVVGVFAGSSMSTYLLANILPNAPLVASAGRFQILIGNDKDYLPTHVSYKLNLTGPSVAVQTACSSSLVAVHLACQSLLQGECDMVLAGGASVLVPHRVGYLYSKDGVASPDGHCRAFDADAQGSVSGSGVGVVVLKRLVDALADRDSIDAVIRGTAINNDGSLKAGFSAPSATGQAAAIAEAHAMAGVSPETITYVEAHGTGTVLGDPVELDALTRAFRLATRKTQFCAIGSIKTNIGHLEAAAGVAGLIKTVLALKHRQLPPSLHFRKANERTALADSPFYVNTSLSAWPSDSAARRAGVSSLGIGGTNAHVVVEEAPATLPSGPAAPWQLLLLSARSEEALDAATDRLAAHIGATDDQTLADIAYTRCVGRRSFRWRRAVVCRDRQDSQRTLDARDPRTILTGLATEGRCPLTFLFPGLGDHYVNMGRGLYESLSVFRAEIDRCAEQLTLYLGLDVRTILYPVADAGDARQPADDRRATLDFRRLLGRSAGGDGATSGPLHRTDIAQPTLFAVEYALAKAWMRIGVVPDAMIGYSIGEYVAACLADVLSLEDALQVVARRAQWIQQCPAGAMLAVPLTESELIEILEAPLTLAAINAPSICVVSGPVDRIAALETTLTARQIACRRLETSHAFHSAQLEPAVEPLVQLLSGIALRPPAIPFVSNLTGTWISDREATDPWYWAHQMTRTVRFCDAVGETAPIGGIRLEVGPGHGLSTLALQHPAVTEQSDHVVATSLRHDFDPDPDLAWWLKTVGKLWIAGRAIDWTNFYEHQQRRRVALPTYPFERQRCWIDPPVRRAIGASPAADGALAPPLVECNELASAATSKGAHGRRRLLTPYVAPRNDVEATLAGIWAASLGVEIVGIHDSFLELGGHSLLGSQMLLRINAAFGVELRLRGLFNAPTIAELAGLVTEEILREIEELPESTA